MSGWTLEEQKETLISIITWYRDFYHRSDFGHGRMIEEIRASTEVEKLEPYWQITDGWLDNR